MTTANKITFIRILCVPIFMAILLIDFPYSNFVALALFAAASLTDAVDGYIARHYNQITDLGKFLDPLADKLLVTAAILVLVEWGQVTSWVAMIIITREFAVTGLRLVAVSSGRVIAAAKSGKVKTFVSIVAICIMLTPLHSTVIIEDFLTVNGVAVAAILVTTLYSGVEYFWKNRDVLRWKT